MSQNLVVNFASVEQELQNKVLFDELCKQTKNPGFKPSDRFFWADQVFSFGKTYQITL